MGTPLILSLAAFVLSLGAVAVAILLARTSPPASVNRTARRVTDVADDVEARATALERRMSTAEEYVESRLAEMDVLAEGAKKRLRGARRAEQAVNPEGENGGLPPIGDPRRREALERRFGG